MAARTKPRLPFALTLNEKVVRLRAPVVLLSDTGALQRETMMARDAVSLRPVVDEDIGLFYDHQRDQASTAMAGFPPRSLQDHEDHWERIQREADVVTRTVLWEGMVAGNVVSWIQDGHREVGYWIDRSHWGRGIATRALQLFLSTPGVTRPLHAHVAAHNAGSIRVLEKCGFVASYDAGIEDEVEFVLRETPRSSHTVRL